MKNRNEQITYFLDQKRQLKCTFISSSYKAKEIELSLDNRSDGISFDIWTLFYKTECRRLLIQYIIITVSLCFVRAFNSDQLT
ncbi:hypothetical protein T4B_13912 [Trichinella pseudospiralis]|uniref:Uncharacterized protein n=1 Tax=Trichinella pseudospiralis TaxID=6337 RepID=A0A0V1JC78_TRIPS|nr:hypothetical protein T4B_13912 [Trichinella pseudospiralis]